MPSCFMSMIFPHPEKCMFWIEDNTEVQNNKADVQCEEFLFSLATYVGIC